MKFERGGLKVSEVAAVFHMDTQTIRVMMQMGIVPWGKAMKMPGSSRYMYIISPKAFYEDTGVLLGGLD